MPRSTNIEKLAIKLELKRLEIEAIKTREEEKRKTLELEAQLSKEKKKDWADTITKVSDSCKQNALDRIDARRNPRKSKREYFEELDAKKQKESDDFMKDLLKIAKEIKDETEAEKKERVSKSEIEGVIDEGNGNNHIQ